MLMVKSKLPRLTVSASLQHFRHSKQQKTMLITFQGTHDTLQLPVYLFI